MIFSIIFLSIMVGLLIYFFAEATIPAICLIIWLVVVSTVIWCIWWLIRAAQIYVETNS